MQPSETPSTALDRLRGELARHREQNGAAHAQHYHDARPSVEGQLRDVPLVHGINDIQVFQSALSDRALRSRADRGLDPLRPESYLGLADVVYSSAGILYPDMNFAIILSPTVEARVSVEASPWDSGAICRSLCPHLPKATESPIRREIFWAHTLPAPQYRLYLMDYVASCFHTGIDYLLGHDPVYVDPLSALSDSWTSRSFEVRLRNRVPLDTWTVIAFFLLRDSKDKASLSLRKTIEPLQQQGVDVFSYDGAKRSLQWVVKDWMSRRAHEAQVATLGSVSG